MKSLWRPCSPEIRAWKYHASGYVFADTAQDLGIPLTGEEREQWAGVMRGLAAGDEAVEMGMADDVGVLAQCVGLEADDRVNKVLGDLADASRAAMEARTLSQHFDARTAEGILSAELFRAISPEVYASYDIAWQELDRIGVLAVMLDSMCDAKEDARTVVPQFGAFDLLTGAARRLLGVSRQIKISTWKSMPVHSREQGLDVYIATKPLRILGSLAVSS